MNEMAHINDPDEIAAALRSARTIAVVGCSPSPHRASNSIARYLIGAGYDVFPVNPGFDEILGRRAFASLEEIPAAIQIDVVDVFRRSEFIPDIAAAALSRGAGFFWMQDGVADEEWAAKLARSGIGVAMDRCIYRDRESLLRFGSVI